jgi:hypothetical protein
MMSKELMEKILDGKDIKKDIKSFVLPDMMKIITLNYERIEIDYDNMCIWTYLKNGEVSECWDLTMIIGVQYYVKLSEDKENMNIVRNKYLPT